MPSPAEGDWYHAAREAMCIVTRAGITSQSERACTTSPGAGLCTSPSEMRDSYYINAGEGMYVITRSVGSVHHRRR